MLRPRAALLPKLLTVMSIVTVGLEIPGDEQELAGEADDPERRITKARLARSAIDRHPDF